MEDCGGCTKQDRSAGSTKVMSRSSLWVNVGSRTNILRREGLPVTTGRKCDDDLRYLPVHCSPVAQNWRLRLQCPKAGCIVVCIHTTLNSSCRKGLRESQDMFGRTAQCCPAGLECSLSTSSSDIERRQRRSWLYNSQSTCPLTCKCCILLKISQSGRS